MKREGGGRFAKGTQPGPGRPRKELVREDPYRGAAFIVRRRELELEINVWHLLVDGDGDLLRAAISDALKRNAHVPRFALEKLDELDKRP